MKRRLFYSFHVPCGDISFIHVLLISTTYHMKWVINATGLNGNLYSCSLIWLMKPLYDFAFCCIPVGSGLCLLPMCSFQLRHKAFNNKKMADYFVLSLANQGVQYWYTCHYTETSNDARCLAGRHLLFTHILTWIIKWAMRHVAQQPLLVLLTWYTVM